MKRGKPAPIPFGAKVHPRVYLRRIQVEAYCLKLFLNSYYANEPGDKPGYRKGKFPISFNPN